MKRSIGIYCCGGIKKGAQDDHKILWSDIERQVISTSLPGYNVIFLNPDDRSDDVSNAWTVFGRDHFQVSLSDFIVVDLRQKRGIGVGIEMLSAKLLEKPLVAVAPPDSHYKRKNLHYLGQEVDGYVHAHLFGLADCIVDDFQQAGQWINNYLQNPQPIKGNDVITQAIVAYKETQLNRDKPMLGVLE